MTHEEFRNAIVAINQNNIDNEAQWSDWQMVGDIEEWLGQRFDGNHWHIIYRAIQSNGASLDLDMMQEVGDE